MTNPRWGEDDLLDLMLEFDPAPAITDTKFYRAIIGTRGEVTVTVYVRVKFNLPHIVLHDTSEIFSSHPFDDPIEAINFALDLHHKLIEEQSR